jgi:RNA polymerase sigma factor (sigma-70 family)
VDQTAEFERDRPRLLRVAGRILGDPYEAEDAVQGAWLRLQTVDDEIHNLQGWLTTATTRLCLDRLRARIPAPLADIPLAGKSPDPAEDLALAETVGVALQVLLDRLTPTERVAFILHDSFGFDFSTISGILGTTPVAARKLASRARSKITQRGIPSPGQEPLADWEVVDAFLDAARNGDFARLLELLAPTAVVQGDSAAVTLGTPVRIDGREPVARFFNGAAKAALPVYVEDRAGAAWFQRGEPKVVFDFTVGGGLVQLIEFRAEPAVFAQVARRRGLDRE